MKGAVTLQRMIERMSCVRKLRGKLLRESKSKTFKYFNPSYLRRSVSVTFITV